MLQNKKLKCNATSAIAEVALSASNCDFSTSDSLSGTNTPLTFATKTHYTIKFAVPVCHYHQYVTSSSFPYKQQL